MNVKDLTYDFENEVFYFFSLAEKTVYRYNVSSGRVQSILDKVDGYVDEYSIGRMIAVGSEKCVLVKCSPFNFSVFDAENYSTTVVPICQEYQTKPSCPTHIGKIFSLHAIGDHLLALITTKGYVNIYDYTNPERPELVK
jgi:hypothetical protein